MTNKFKTTSPHTLEPPQPARPAWVRALPYAAIAAAMAFAVCLGVRPLSSPDLGYHLAYGDDFLRTDRIVDCNEYVYTLPPADTPSDKRPEPGPGCWYDKDGKYRFVNANWGTQVVMSVVNRSWGTTGLCVLGASLVAGLFTMCLLTMLRLDVPRVLAAGGIILIGLTAYERFMLRPELFGYFLLTAQLCLLVGRRDSWHGRLAHASQGHPAPAAVSSSLLKQQKEKEETVETATTGETPVRRMGGTPMPRTTPMPPISVAALILLQLIFVNMHSYFLLGLILTGAFFAEAAARRTWPAIRGRQLDEPDRRAMNARLMILGIVLAGQIAVSFVNPWTWRLVALPFQTVLFVNQNQINAGLPPDLAAGQTLPPDVHPWRIIGEFFGPLNPGFAAASKATIAYKILLAMAAAGVLAAVIRRKWAILMIIVAMTAVSFSMRRNIAPAAMVIVPLVIATLSAWPRMNAPAGGVRDRCHALAGRAEPYFAAAATLAGLILMLMVTQQYFYSSERMPTRFGMGVSKLDMPVGAAEWLNRHKPAGRLWVDYNNSSNVYYFTDRRYDVPVVTNTWAYPPAVMRRVLDATYNRNEFERAVRDYGIETLVIYVDRGTESLIRSLMNSDTGGTTQPADWSRWQLVYLDAIRAIFLRSDGPNAALATREARKPEKLDVAEAKKTLLSADSVPAHSLATGGVTYSHIGWYDPAIEMLEDSLGRDPSCAGIWDVLGTCYGNRGDSLIKDGKTIKGRADLVEAQRCFNAAFNIDPTMPGVADHLNHVRKQLAEH